MAKPSKLLITLGTQFDTIKSNVINQLFEKLEEIRQYHNNGDPNGAKTSGFPSNSQGRNSEYINTSLTNPNDTIDITYPTKIKEYISALEESSYIKNKDYHNQIIIPTSHETLIKAADYFNDYIDTINSIIDDEIVTDSSYCGADYSDCSCVYYCWTHNSMAYAWEACTGYVP